MDEESPVSTGYSGHTSAPLSLDGTWEACVADDGIRRTWLEAGARSGGIWVTADVPGHWRSAEGLATTDGPVLYRRSFELPEANGAERWWLELDGVFYQGDVWLDAAYVGDTEGYFFPHTFEVTDLIRKGTDHTLGIEVTCTPPADRSAKRSITGIFQHWDCFDPDWNPGGVWRSVRLRPSGPVAIGRLRVLCIEASDERAVLELSAELDSSIAAPVKLRTTVGDTDHEWQQPVAAGENKVRWRVTIDKPSLWWPHALGSQPLHEVTVAVMAAGLPAPSDERHLITGLRSVRLRNWICEINGERIFLKGTNLAPARMALGEATAAEIAHDIHLAKDAGLDLVRVHGHVSRAELYATADEAGMLVWQDFPLQWGYHRSIRAEAARQASRAVDVLGHHPSVALWCCHNEPFALALEPGTPLEPAKTARKFLAAQELPSWNKTVIDRGVKRAFRNADPTRPVISHSGVLPHPPRFDGTDSHLYFGWYHGHERDLPALAQAWPRLVRFVSEFGAQAVPITDDFIEPARWPDLDWERLARTHGLQRKQFDRYVPPTAFESFEAWRRASQDYQATVIKHHIETLRRLKYRPTGGFAQFLLGDAHPAISWSVLDHRRVPKAGWDALVDACRPVIIVADRPPPQLHPGEVLNL